MLLQASLILQCHKLTLALDTNLNALCAAAERNGGNPVWMLGGLVKAGIVSPSAISDSDIAPGSHEVHEKSAEGGIGKLHPDVPAMPKEAGACSSTVHSINSFKNVDSIGWLASHHECTMSAGGTLGMRQTHT